MRPGTSEHPLRVAIVGSGPAGFYAADHFFKQADVVTHVDMFDRLPTPFGLVRGGVAPDHQKIKNVTRVFDRIAHHDHFCFFGNVELGLHVSIDDLLEHYHAVVLATGAQTDRPLGVPGDNLMGSYSATEFVAWYNGHPDFAERSFPLDATDVVVVGVGNVAVDVARILCKTPAELEGTDIADYALRALRTSAVSNVYMLGRRGAAQAAFTAPEARELGELEDADVLVDAPDLDGNALFQATEDRETQSKITAIRDLMGREARDVGRKLHLRFLTSPVELVGDENGRVSSVRIVRNELVAGADGAVKARPTSVEDEIPAQLVFRSVGYRGVQLPGLPFDEASGTIPNDRGRVSETRGAYVTGWIKRGPSGVIGTNKPDAVETVESILEDLRHDRLHAPSSPEHASIVQLIRERQPDAISYEDWLCVDAREVKMGADTGRPRIKVTTVREMLEIVRENQSAAISRA
jgi:ferredoxin/flavodoxin---NADP+ reductase